MSDPKMTKGYALVVCENGHDIWGGETEEEAQKHTRRQCRECDAEPEENFVRWTPPRVIPPTEADTLRAELAELRAENSRLRDALRPFLRIADHCAKASEESWSKARRLQEAAKLARAGKQEEANAMVRAIDKQPRVWDFSKTVSELSDAAKSARAALASPLNDEGAGKNG